MKSDSLVTCEAFALVIASEAELPTLAPGGVPASVLATWKFGFFKHQGDLLVSILWTASAPLWEGRRSVRRSVPSDVVAGGMMACEVAVSAGDN